MGIPRTRSGLESWMEDNCINFNNYSINGNSIFEGLGIDYWGSGFTWYYIERGQKNNLKYFQTESEVVEYAFNQINSDKWAKSHCIGFTTNIAEKIELSRILSEIGADFFQDEIPYYGLDHLAYRTFIIGCDIKKASYLKDKYYKPK